MTDTRTHPISIPNHIHILIPIPSHLIPLPSPIPISNQIHIHIPIPIPIPIPSPPIPLPIPRLVASKYRRHGVYLGARSILAIHNMSHQVSHEGCGMRKEGEHRRI